MSLAESLDELLTRAARTAGLADLLDAEAADALFETWAATPDPELGDRSPRAVATGLAGEELLDALALGAEARDGQPPRLLAEEVLARLSRELAAPSHGAELPTLALLGTLALAEPESDEDPIDGCLAAVEVLRRWGDPLAARWLLPVLAVEDARLRAAAAVALGQTGLAALDPIAAALAGARDPDLRRGLLDALTRLPQTPSVSAQIRSAWQAASGEERQWLAEGIGRYGDPALAPLLEADAQGAHPSRFRWAIYRVALRRLGRDQTPVPPPPLHAAAAADLLAGCHALVGGSLESQAREWLQEGIASLDQTAETAPEQVDWFLYEQFQGMADRLWQRDAIQRLHRFRRYALGALQFYGALKLTDLIDLVTVPSGLPAPDADALWHVLAGDRRLRLHPSQVVAVPEVADVAGLMAQREAAGLPPALLPMQAIALAARGAWSGTWTASEAEAARAVQSALPPELADADQILELQRALRGATGNDTVMDALRDFLRNALAYGTERSQGLKDALAELWQHTPRWDLFGHSPWSAQQTVQAMAGDSARPTTGHSPCPCGSGRPYRRCCGRAH